MKLVENAKQAWRWISVQCMFGAGVLTAVWENMPSDLKTHIPPTLVTGITIGLLVLGIAGRLIKQEPPACQTPLPKIDPAMLPKDAP